MSHFRNGSHKREEYFGSKHRFEHWYRDNTVYFITARCRDQFPAFDSERAKEIFWDRFDHYAQKYGFQPDVTSLLNNHYHTVGYLPCSTDLAPFIQHLHGSVAKLVNDLLVVRLTPFWVDSGHQNYFDGCLRDETQYRRTHDYVLTQAVRHRLFTDWRDYRHTHVIRPLEEGLAHAIANRAFLPTVPYKRYGGG